MNICAASSRRYCKHQLKFESSPDRRLGGTIAKSGQLWWPCCQDPSLEALDSAPNGRTRIPEDTDSALHDVMDILRDRAFITLRNGMKFVHSVLGARCEYIP